MRYQHRMTFSTKTDRKIVRFLKRHNIKYEEDNGPLHMGVCLFYEDEEYFPKLMRLLKKKGKFTIITTEYTKEEFDHATWISVRSKWLNDYPQPEDTYEQIVYGVDTEKQCLCNKKQINNFRIKREIKWGKRYFCSLNWVYDELFVNQEIVEELKQSGLKGFHIRDVNIKSKISKTTKQLVVENYLQEGFDKEKTKIREKVYCQICGTEKYIMSGKEQYYRKEAFDKVDVDIIKSKTIYGMGTNCSREIYISKKFYRYLKENKYDKNLVFEPIFLE